LKKAKKEVETLDNLLTQAEATVVKEEKVLEVAKDVKLDQPVSKSLSKKPNHTPKDKDDKEKATVVGKVPGETNKDKT